MGSACAVVDARADGATLWTGSQKPHFARDGVARGLGLPQEKVHGIWVPGPGSYGRNDAGDAGIDAALLSKAVGRPVRVQGMRYEGHGWDPKGPASIHRVRAALDKDGSVIGYAFESKGFSRIDIDTNESDPAYSLAGQLMGLPLKPLQGFGVPAESYGFANKLLAWETIAPLLDTFPERFRKRATTFGGFDYDAIPQSALDVSEQERLATYEGLWNLGP